MVITYSFDVDLESVEGFAALRLDLLLVELDSLLLEEVLHGGFGHLAIVGKSVGLDAPRHVHHVVLGAYNLVFWQFADPLDQLFVLPLKHYNAAWENARVLHVLVKGWFFTLGKLFLLVLDR